MRTRTFFIVLFIVALVGVGAWYFLYTKIVASATAAANAQVERQSAMAASQQDQSLAAFLATSSSTASTLLASVVPADGSVPFITLVEGLAKAANIGLKVQGVSINTAAALAPQASATTFDVLALSLSVQGSWSSLTTFLNMLESLPYKVQLNNISLAQSIFSAPQSNGAVGAPQSFWSGTLSLSALKVLAPTDSPQ